MHRCQRPEPLRPGDRLGVIAPSGALRELSAFEQGLEIWRSQGYVVECLPGVDARWGYLAGRDAHRRQQLHQVWQNPDYRGVLCARGGYGSARLLEGWHWPTAAPKWLIGFSDITGLLLSLSQQGVAGVHGPMLTTLATEPEWSRQRLFSWVSGGGVPPLTGQPWGGGQVTGPLVPVNLAVATNLLGTPVMPDLTGAILAIEDVGEAPYRLDRLLTQWRLMGLLPKLGGIAVGRFSQCEPVPDIPSFTVEEVLRDRLTDLGLPVVAELPFGHDGPNAMLPMGSLTTLDGDQGTLTVHH